jgi:hypothetical protein
MGQQAEVGVLLLAAAMAAGRGAWLAGVVDALAACSSSSSSSSMGQQLVLCTTLELLVPVTACSSSTSSRADGVQGTVVDTGGGLAGALVA